jgi:hypothetical protein
MKVVGADKLRQFSLAKADSGRAAGAWLAEIREASFRDNAALLARYPGITTQADGTMRILLGTSGGWVTIRMNSAAGVVLVTGAGRIHRRCP